MEITAEEIALLLGAMSPLYYAALRTERHLGKLAGIVEHCPYCMHATNGKKKDEPKKLS